MTDEYAALKAVQQELVKLRDKFQVKVDKEKAKAKDIYVTVKGEKCYTDAQIQEAYACDVITSSQCDRYMDQLEKKKDKAGVLGLTKNGYAVDILENFIYRISLEVKDIDAKEEKQRAFNERLERAKENGMSYQEFLDLEEVNRQSEEYERLMGI